MFKNNKSSILLMIFALVFCISATGSVSAADVPTANFTSNITNSSAPLSVQFTCTSTGQPTSWEWNFGDNVTSNERIQSIHIIRPVIIMSALLQLTMQGIIPL